MRNVFLILTLLVGSLVFSQVKKIKLDKSPHDISWYRNSEKAPIIKVVYGRPQKKERTMLGERVPFGMVWRTGANEATEITFLVDVDIKGKQVKKGTYTLFTIPNKDSWTLILNSELNQWGAYNYKEDLNVFESDFPVSTLDETIEVFTIGFNSFNDNAVMVFSWENYKVEVPITF